MQPGRWNQRQACAAGRCPDCANGSRVKHKKSAEEPAECQSPRGCLATESLVEAARVCEPLPTNTSVSACRHDENQRAKWQRSPCTWSCSVQTPPPVMQHNAGLGNLGEGALQVSSALARESGLSWPPLPRDLPALVACVRAVCANVVFRNISSSADLSVVSPASRSTRRVGFELKVFQRSQNSFPIAPPPSSLPHDRIATGGSGHLTVSAALFEEASGFVVNICYEDSW